MGAVGDISRISKFSGRYGDDVTGLDAASLVGLDALASSMASATGMTAREWGSPLHTPGGREAQVCDTRDTWGTHEQGGQGLGVRVEEEEEEDEEDDEARGRHSSSDEKGDIFNSPRGDEGVQESGREGGGGGAGRRAERGGGGGAAVVTGVEVARKAIKAPLLKAPLLQWSARGPEALRGSPLLGGVRQTSPSAEAAADTRQRRQSAEVASLPSLAVPFLLLIHFIYEQFQF